MARRLKVNQQDRETREDIEGLRLSEEAREYAELRWHERSLEDRRKRQGTVLLPLMQERGIGKHRIDFDENTNALIKVKKRETTNIDEDRLRKALGAKRYNKLLSTFLDESKLEAAIQLGEVDPNVVASCMDTSETEYLEVRFTQKRKRTKKTDEE